MQHYCVASCALANEQVLKWPIFAAVAIIMLVEMLAYILVRLLVFGYELSTKQLRSFRKQEVL